MESPTASILEQLHFGLFVKIMIAAGLFLFSIIVFVVFTNVRSLNKVVFIRGTHASTVLQAIVFVYFIITVSLFFLSLVIL